MSTAAKAQKRAKAEVLAEAKAEEQVVVETWLSVTEAAALLKLGTMRVRELCRKQKLVSFKAPNGQWQIAPETVAGYKPTPRTGRRSTHRKCLIYLQLDGEWQRLEEYLEREGISDTARLQVANASQSSDGHV